MIKFTENFKDSAISLRVISSFDFPYNFEFILRYMNKNNPKTKSEAIQIRRIIAEAVDVWQQNSVLTITESPNGTADILIDFMKLDHGDNFSFEGRGGALGLYTQNNNNF